MTIHEPVYATREVVKRALDIHETARVNEQVDRLLSSSSRSIDGSLHRTFYPRLGTLQMEEGETWLNEREVVSVTSLSYDGVPLPSDSYVLKPYSGPPYNRIELLGSAGSAVRLGGTLSGLVTFGYTFDERIVGTLPSSVTDSVEALDISNGSRVGVGDLLRIENEYVLVYGRVWKDSGQGLQSDLTASAGNTGVLVSDGDEFSVGETIMVGTESMWVADIVGNVMMVRRAWDGSTLGEHNTGSDIYVNRGLQAWRGVVGSTASTHPMSTPVYKWVPPSLITQFCVAETLNALEQEQSGYARVVGSGDVAIEARGGGLVDIRSRAMTAHGRKIRVRTV